MSMKYLDHEQPGILHNASCEQDRSSAFASFENRFGNGAFDAYVDQLVSGQGNGF